METEKVEFEPVSRPGEAAIKSKYIVKRSESKEPAAHGADGATSVAAANSEPPPRKKRKKERGQNKRRPRAARVNHSQQLCPSLYQGSHWTERSCQFGEKCRYCHDIAEYLSMKPADIGDSCYLFSTLGRCPYGLACRYGNSHMTSDLQNVTDDGVFDPDRPDTTLNVISRSLQERLRKKQIKLVKSEKYLSETTNGGREREIEQGTAVKEVEKKDGEGREREIEQGTAVKEVEKKDGEGREREIEQGTAVKEVEKKDGEGREREIEQDNTVVVENKKDGGRALLGAVTDEDTVKVRPAEKKKIDFRDKLYLAPLTTVGNLPFRRICKEYGADITCGEMAMATNLLQGQQSEWALLKRHASEDLFGVQVCGAHVDSMTRCAEVVSSRAEVDFIDVNVGCPIDLVCNKGAGCSLMDRRTRFESIVRGMTAVSSCPVTVKMRTGVHNRNWNAHKLLPWLKDCGVAMATVHGRSREQRYTKLADWAYISQCAEAAAPLPVFGCGDVLSYEDHERHRNGQAGIMIARGALIKPWIFTEIKERRHWDISSSERMDILRRYTNYGLEHWGSDTIGVENTRKFLLEWLSFLYRYIPVGLLERLPQRINERPPLYEGRDDLETLMASHYCQDWVKISEMLLGPVPDSFSFLPKHKANSYL